jgi:hypothetical protein
VTQPLVISITSGWFTILTLIRRLNDQASSTKGVRGMAATYYLG